MRSGNRLPVAVVVCAEQARVSLVSSSDSPDADPNCIGATWRVMRADGPGIRYVVDAGTPRISRYSHRLRERI